MAGGLRAFGGPVLLLLSGQDLTAREFLDYAAMDPAWRGILDAPCITRSDFTDADHTFSTAAARCQAEARTVQWLRSSVVGKGHEACAHGSRSTFLRSQEAAGSSARCALPRTPAFVRMAAHVLTAHRPGLRANQPGPHVRSGSRRRRRAGVRRRHASPSVRIRPVSMVACVGLIAGCRGVGEQPSREAG
jgi:hypothetical protein